MADTAVQVTQGVGTNIDTRTETTNGNHRQVVVIGDPSTNAGVAPVDATSGLKVDLGADNDVSVSGTVTANLSATDNAVLDNIDTNTDYGAVTGNGTASGALRVTVANDSTGVVSGDSYTRIWTGAAWVEATGDESNGLDVDVTRVQGTVTVDGSGVTQPVSGTVTANLSATDNAVLDNIDTNTDYGQVTGGGTETGALRVTIANNSTGVVSVDDNGGSLTVDGSVAATQSGTWNVNNVSGTVSLPTGAATAANQSTANAALSAIQTAVETLDNIVSGSEAQVDVVASLPAGTNAIGDVGIEPRTSGGLSIFRSIDIDESEEEIKSTTGQLFSISAFNTTDAPIYLKFYNLTAASTTVGTSTPALTFVVPGNANSDGSGFVWNNDIGLEFTTAITVAATTGVADSDTGAPGANACIVNIGYK